MKNWRTSCVLSLAAILPAGAAERRGLRAGGVVHLRGLLELSAGGRLLEKLDAAAVVLSEHVTYWDHEGGGIVSRWMR